MTVITDQLPLTKKEQTIRMLHELGFPIHRVGYKMLCIAIPLYDEVNIQSITKELYDILATEFGCGDWRPIERDIRDVIHRTWASGDSAAWDKYFPGYKQAPSNKVFIATLAEYLR